MAKTYFRQDALERAVIDALGLQANRVRSIDLHFAYDSLPTAKVELLAVDSEGKLESVFRDFAFYAIPEDAPISVPVFERSGP